MDLSGTIRLRRGYYAVRRGDGRLQLGVDPPHRAVVPDDTTTHTLLQALREGVQAPHLSPDHHRLLHQLAEAGLLESATPAAARDERAGIALDLPEKLRAPVTSLLAEADLVVDPSAPVVLVADPGEIARARTDLLLQEGRAHLVVSGGPRHWTLGPFVLPGLTACLRCVDAHLAVHDPRRLIVVEQLARRPAEGGDNLLGRLALAWAIHDLRRWLDGSKPSSWSATYTIGSDGPLRHSWLRHPDCGCAWDALPAEN